MSRANLLWCLPAVILAAVSVAAQELQPPRLPLPAPTPRQLPAPHPIAQAWGREAPSVSGTYSVPEPRIIPVEFQVPRPAPVAPPASQPIFESPPIDTPSVDTPSIDTLSIGTLSIDTPSIDTLSIAPLSIDTPPIDTPDIALAVLASSSPVGRQVQYGCKGCGLAACDVCSSGGGEPCHHWRGGAEPCPDFRGYTSPGRIEQWWQTRMKPCLQESHWGYAEQFEEKPFGASLRVHLNTQVCNGAKDRMVLYRYDFHEGILGPANELNPHGQRRLTELARMLRCNIFPLVIEPSRNDPALDAERRDHVLGLLEDSTFAVPEDWVVIQRPNARGLSGEGAMRVYQSLVSGAGPAASTGSATSGAGTTSEEGESTE